MDKALVEDMMGFVAAIVGMGCLTGVLITWLKARAGKHLRMPDITSRLDEIAARIGQIDHAVDTMAVEVERISEGQRFVARVLAERASDRVGERAVAPVLPDKAKAGSTTPH